MQSKSTYSKSKKASLRFNKFSLLFWLIGLSLGSLNAQTYAPNIYYTFDGANPLSDSVSSGLLNANYYSCPYTIANNAATAGARKYLKFDNNSTSIFGSNFIPDTALTIEFLIRPGQQFDLQSIMYGQNGCFSIGMGYPFINFNTTAYTASGAQYDNSFRIDLTNVGRKSYGYYVDGNWHHMVFKYNAKTGVKQIWVDGQNPAGFQTTATTTNCHFTTTGSLNGLFLNTTYAPYRFNGDIDEIAAYKYDLHSNMIYKHYLDFLSHNHYSYQWSSVPAPAPSPVTAGIDMNEYPAGHPNVTMSEMDQLRTFPGARYRPNHTLLPMGTYINWAYLAGYHWPGVSDYQAVVKSVELQTILAKNYNFAICVAGATTEWQYFGDTTQFSGAWIKLANSLPNLPATCNTAWPHVEPNHAGFKANESYTTCRCLPNSSYLQNNSGQFVDLNGNVTTDKILAPDAPLDSIKQDGMGTRWCFNKLFQKLTRPLQFINDEKENLVTYDSSQAGVTGDASVLAAKNASGLNWSTYLGRKYAGFCKIYRDSMMSLPQLANTKWQFYESEGHNFYRPKYSEIRTAQTPINGTNYPIASIYARFPDNWKTGYSAWNGWNWFVESRAIELSYNDNYCSPAVGAGWDSLESNNIRPGQWLGLCKAMSMAGAEYFFPAFFVLGGTAMQNPRNYVWQAIVPSYAQAITTRYEDLFKSGYVMPGDVPLSLNNPTGPKAYSFQAGDQRKLVVVRKSNTGNRYAITGTIQPLSNEMGSTEVESTATIALDGQTVKFKVRRQGSTYIYDNTASPAKFYQLDGWHEYSHPANWSRNFEIEGELFDNNNSSLAIKTYVPAGTVAGDYTNFTSCAGFTTATDAKYNFSMRELNPTTYYFWVRARSKSGSTGLDIKMDGVSSGSINCITDTNWTWYRINSNTTQPIVFTSLSINNHELTLTAQNTNIEIDKAFLTTQSGAIYGNGGTSCSPVSAVITANGPTTFCLGGNVTLTANAGTTYSWSNGQTTQSIGVNSAGTYIVTVSNTSGNTAVSSSVTVTVKSLPVASISSAGDSLCPGTSLSLAAAAATTYSWSTGATTQNININSAGSYTVTVTNVNSCTATTSKFIRNGSCAPVVVITANGPLSFCNGGNVVLSASTSNSYVWSTGATTKTITAATTGNYTVTVSNVYGATALTSVYVEVNPTPVATIASSAGDSICPGTTMILTASSTNSYLWSTGSVSKSITISSAGTYTVTVASVKGCTSSTSFQVKQGYCPLPAVITPIGPTNFCSGNSLMLIANSANSYLWSTGATSQAITVTASGNYEVTISDIYGQIAKTSIPVTVYPSPSVSISSNAGDSLCPGTSLTLQAIGTGDYAWSTGSTTGSITVNSTGTYELTITNSYGCNNSTSFTAMPGVCAAPDAQVTASGNTSFCDGGSVQLSAAPGNSYSWSNGATTQNVSITAAGTYMVTVTNWAGLSAVSVPVIVTVYYTPSAHITSSGPLNICAPNTVTLTANICYSYLWSTGETTQSIVVSQAGSYYVTLINKRGCTGISAPATVTVGNCTTPCAAPYNLLTGSITSTSARIKWEKTFVADSINYVCTNVATGVSISGTVKGKPRYIDLYSLTPATVYKWSLRQVCSSGISISSDTVTFITKDASFGSRVIDETVVENDNVRLYPNPTRDNLNIAFTSDIETMCSIKVTDVAGKLLTVQQFNSTTGEQTHTINVSSLSPGIYFVELEKNSGVKRLKFIKQQ
ncbi:MAG: T9SS type A sorting domain-containing protein [Bacteroidia bacterium]